MGRPSSALALLLLVGPMLACAQSALPAYEIVSVREAPANPSFRGVKVEPDRTEMMQTLRDLVSYAYGMRPEFVFGGPSWGSTTIFDVNALVAGDDVATLEKLSFKERAPMLRPILTERFGLKVHTEIRTLPVYEVVVAKGGIKLPPPRVVPAGSEGTLGSAGTSMSGNGVSVTRFITLLSQAFSETLGRPLVDKTGLTERYDFYLHWREETEGATKPALSIFTAMEEQLGLKLQAARDPVETMVIDAVHLPTDN